MRRLVQAVAMGVLLGGAVAPPAWAQTPPTATAPAPVPAETVKKTVRKPPAKPRMTFARRFAAANTTHDGKLTRDQAMAAKMTGMVKFFDTIDKDHKGFVTRHDVAAFRKTPAGRRVRL